MAKRQKVDDPPPILCADLWNYIASHTADLKTLVSLASTCFPLRRVLYIHPKWRVFFYARYVVGPKRITLYTYAVHTRATIGASISMNELMRNKGIRNFLAMLWSHNPNTRSAQGDRYFAAGPADTPYETPWVSLSYNKQLKTVKWVIGTRLDATTYIPVLYATSKNVIYGGFPRVTGHCRITPEWYQTWVVEEGFKTNVRKK